MKVTPITSPINGEHIAATWPDMKPSLQGSSTESVDPRWKIRLNYWAGRALNTRALEYEQENRSGKLSWIGRHLTPGVVTGLEAALETPEIIPDPLSMDGHFIHILPGHGITVSGDDITIPRPIRVALNEIRIEQGESESNGIPWAGVLVLRPAEFRQFKGHNPDDSCEYDLSRDAFADERRQDASFVHLVPLPEEWKNLDTIGNLIAPRLRNRIAHVIFSMEGAQVSRMEMSMDADETTINASAILTPTQYFPWEAIGLPIALIGVERDVRTNTMRFFLDRSVVARKGGLAHSRSRPTANPYDGNSMIWKARIDQFTEHLADLHQRVARKDLENHVQFVPPSGLLPREVLNIITTEQAQLLDTKDRAASNEFFPREYVVEAVPIPEGELNAAMAASASLAPFDFGVPTDEKVRLLLPVSQHFFDSNLLVIEEEDPVFVQAIDRLIFEKQDWQRRCVSVQKQSHVLEHLLTGVAPTFTKSFPEDELLGTEPEDPDLGLEFTEALLSPVTGRPPIEMKGGGFFPTKNSDGVLQVHNEFVLYVTVGIDPVNPPGPITLQWNGDFKDRDNNDIDVIHTWDSVFELIVKDTNQDVTNVRWIQLRLNMEQFNLQDSDAQSFSLKADYGRLAVSQAGYVHVEPSGKIASEAVMWKALSEDSRHIYDFPREDWTFISGDQLSKPFEGSYEPIFEDGATLDERLDELDEQLGYNRNANSKNVRQRGVRNVVKDLERQLKRGNDVVDLSFLGLQANTHRIRSGLVGDDSQSLLLSPVFNNIIEHDSAKLSREQLRDAYQSLATLDQSQTRTTAAAGTRDTTTGSTASRGRQFTSTGGLLKTDPANTSIGSGAGAPRSKNTGSASSNTNFRNTVGTDFPLFQGTKPGSVLKPGSSKDVVESEPIIGAGFELRTLSLSQRFDVGIARKALTYADAGLLESLSNVPDLFFGSEEDNSVIPEVFIPDGDKERRITFRELALNKDLLDKIQVSTVKDEDESSNEYTNLFSYSIRRSDATALILRRFELFVAKKRETLEKALEIMEALEGRVDAASKRIVTLNGKIEEVQHDLSVARALYGEELRRIDEINTRRDTIIRDEVRFVAFVRPRTIDLAGTELPYWQLRSSEADAPVPACLKQHDEAPDALRAYIQLFHHAPARWFKQIRTQVGSLNTKEKLFELMTTTQQSARNFVTRSALPFVAGNLAQAPLKVLQTNFSVIEGHRRIASEVIPTNNRLIAWSDQRRRAERNASLGDLIEGRHGNARISSKAASELERIEQVATCLHAELAGIPPVIRLAWIERYSQFDKPSPLDQLYVMPKFEHLPRETKRRLQEYVDWMFSRIDQTEEDAFNLINDLVRISLLLASYAPVREIISGHVPKPTKVRPGVLIPLRPSLPDRVRVGMRFHVLRESKIVARGRVEDLRDNEVNVRVSEVESENAIIDETMKVDFIPAVFAVSGTNRVLS